MKEIDFNLDEICEIEDVKMAKKYATQIFRAHFQKNFTQIIYHELEQSLRERIRPGLTEAIRPEINRLLKLNAESLSDEDARKSFFHSLLEEIFDENITSTSREYLRKLIIQEFEFVLDGLRNELRREAYLNMNDLKALSRRLIKRNLKKMENLNEKTLE